MTGARTPHEARPWHAARLTEAQTGLDPSQPQQSIQAAQASLLPKGSCISGAGSQPPSQLSRQSLDAQRTMDTFLAGVRLHPLPLRAALHAAGWGAALHIPPALEGLRACCWPGARAAWTPR